MDNAHRAVVITGVSSGIGAAIAQHLIDQQYIVFGSVRKSEDAASLVEQNPGRFHPLVFDVRDRDSVKAAAATVSHMLSESGHTLAAIVNNAGIAQFGPMECLDDQQFEDTVAVNLFGTRNVTNAFLPLLRSHKKTANSGSKGAGVIVNISSLSGILNTPMNGAYCVSKHAMESIGEIYRRELYSSGIDVCAIRSGPIQSEIWAKNIIDKTEYEQDSYNLMSANAISIMKKADKNALPASVISTLVLDVIERRKCKVAYEIGDGSRISKILSSSFLPVRWVDKLIMRAMLKHH